MMKKLFIFCLAVMMAVSMTFGPIASTVQAAEKVQSIPWVYKWVYKDIVQYIFENGDFNPWTYTVSFYDEPNEVVWEIYLFQGYILVWEMNSPREGAMFVNIDDIRGTGLGCDGFGMLQEDGTFIELSDADIYKVCFHKYLCKFWHTYVTPEVDEEPVE